jgi:hypothetical protein
VEGSVFRHFGVGFHAQSGIIRAEPWTTPGQGPGKPITIEDNYCGGIWVERNGLFTADGPSIRVANNASAACPGAGVYVTTGGSASLASIEVVNNYANGISVSGKGLVTLGAGITVSGNPWGGLDVAYDSLALGPAAWDTTPPNISILENGTDLWCDSSSRITGMGHFMGAPITACDNFVP